MNNFEKIQSLNKDELAMFLYNIAEKRHFTYSFLDDCVKNAQANCLDIYFNEIQWLQSEYKEYE